MKTETVRIKEEQARRLQVFADMIPGSSISVIVQRAVEQWLDVEGPVYLAAFKEARAKVQERQAVRPVASIRPSERA
jgi:predicted transcriptional regulator